MKPLCPLAAALAASLALTTSGASAQSTDYDRATGEASRLEGAGRPREAALALDAIAGEYPEDFELSLRLGWLWFQARDWSASRRYYTRALSLSSGGSAEARLGLGWSLLRAGEPSLARREFARLVEGGQASASARQGLALATAVTPRPVRAWASLWLGVQGYVNHPSRRVSFNVTPSLALQFNDLVVVGVTWRAFMYRATSVVLPPRPPPGFPPPRVGTSTANYWQQEVHGTIGVARANWAVRAHAGWLYDASNTLAPAYTFGLSAWARALGELSAEASGTVFQDVTVYRASAQWALALSQGFLVGPLVSAQYGDGVGWALGAVATYRRRGWSLALAARIGEERRPTYLNWSLMFAMDDRIRAAAGLTARAPLGRGFTLAAGYEWLRLETTLQNNSTQASDLHGVTLALETEW